MERFKKIASIFEDSLGPKLTNITKISTDLQYHVDNKIDISNNVFRPESEAFYSLINEARELWQAGILKVSYSHLQILGIEPLSNR